MIQNQRLWRLCVDKIYDNHCTAIWMNTVCPSPCTDFFVNLVSNIVWLKNHENEQNKHKYLQNLTLNLMFQK